MKATASVKPPGLSPIDARKRFVKTVFRFGILALAIGGMMLSNLSYAESLSLTHTVYLEPGNGADPKAIVQAHDGGIIVVGSIDSDEQPQKHAWAAKTDGKGDPVWRYTLPPRENVPNFGGPEYTSVAVMPDDSVFLCGGMPGIKTGSALLTHLDKGGKLLSEQLPHPKGLSGGGFAACMASGDGIVAVGLTAVYKPNDHPTPLQPFGHVRVPLYWIVFFDSRGQMKWEKLIPVSATFMGSIPDDISQLQPIGNDGAMFTAYAGGLDTEVVHILPNQEIKTTTLKGDFVLAMPTSTGDDLQLISRVAPFTRLAMSADLRQTGSVVGKHELLPSHLDAAYCLPDKSMMLFGAIFGPGEFRQHGYAGVAKIDPTLQHAHTLNLSPQRDSFWVQVAAPLAVPGTFVAARDATKVTRETNVFDLNDRKKSHLGVALDFIKLN